MTTFSSILEEWAKIYKPIAHNPEEDHKAFFKIDTEKTENEFKDCFNRIDYPVLGYDTRIHASVSDRNQNVIAYHQYVLFMIRQKSATSAKTVLNDADEAANCKNMLDKMCQELLTYLANLKKAAPSGKMEINNELTVMISSEDAQTLQGTTVTDAQWETDPRHLGSWWIATLELTVMAPRRKCLDINNYG